LRNGVFYHKGNCDTNKVYNIKHIHENGNEKQYTERVSDEESRAVTNGLLKDFDFLWALFSSKPSSLWDNSPDKSPK